MVYPFNFSYPIQVTRILQSQITSFLRPGLVQINSALVKKWAAGLPGHVALPEGAPTSIQSLSEFIAYFLCRQSLDFGKGWVLQDRTQKPSEYLSRKQFEDQKNFHAAWGVNPSSDGLEYLVQNELLDEYFGEAWSFAYAEHLKPLFSNNVLKSISETLALLIENSRALTDLHALTVSSAFPLGFADDFCKKSITALGLAVLSWSRAVGTQIHFQVSPAVDHRVCYVLKDLGVLTFSSELQTLLKKNSKHLEFCSEAERAIRAAAYFALCEMAENSSLSAFEVSLFFAQQMHVCRSFDWWSANFAY